MLVMNLSYILAECDLNGSVSVCREEATGKRSLILAIGCDIVMCGLPPGYIAGSRVTLVSEWWMLWAEKFLIYHPPPGAKNLIWHPERG